MDRRRRPDAKVKYGRGLTGEERRWGSRQKYVWAKEMRGDPTSAEAIMWEWLKGNLTGVHFRRQAVVQGRILDFYSGLVRIAVEVDGKTHDPAEDRERDAELRKVGVATIRVPARRVYRDVGAVFDDVRGRIFGILARDGWRRRRYLEYYGPRLSRTKSTKDLAIRELYDKLAAL